ncbi:hypothetical protein FPZ12_041465 [Amycolatopsis acidicola]|uniref:Uncharacterized protein n=1 Tax=Amycolatopsis acidicola TaxID=2596893 RepID=A0A5N0UKY2_9PSEU|nr:hypothetical protein [Amycolatopsis acidicola]KAA9150313.1 hypothetical protein FPZ12_041465 [Amycolatopsis acidicola]
MSVREGPLVFDVFLGAVAGTGRRIVRLARPLAVPVTKDWPAPLRGLAESGFRARREVGGAALNLYRRAAPAAVTDVLDRLDLTGIVRDVLDEIDLPGIIRASTGSVATESVRDVRIRMVAADDAVSRWFGRGRPVPEHGR